MITQQDILDLIKEKDFLRIPNTTHIICCLTLYNGFTVIGDSVCLEPDIFNAETGESVAFDNAKAKLWQLEAYSRKQQEFTNEVAKKEKVSYTSVKSYRQRVAFAATALKNRII